MKHPLMVFALVLNLFILVPVVAGLLTGIPFTPDNLGPVTDGRLILTCVYASIALLSAILIALHIYPHDWAVPMTVALFAAQIFYKALSVVLVGVDNPVVMANIFVIIVQISVLGLMFGRKRGKLTNTGTLSV